MKVTQGGYPQGQRQGNAITTDVFPLEMGYAFPVGYGEGIGRWITILAWGWVGVKLDEIAYQSSKGLHANRSFQ